MAIALLRNRLKDPHAHLPSPTHGSVDELNVMGYYFLALALYTVVRRDKLYEMPEDDELLDALRRASDGLVRYAYDKGTQASALDMLVINLARRHESLEGLQVNQRLVELLKDMHKEDPLRTDPTLNEESGQEETPLDRLATALQSLANSHSEVYQHREAVKVIEEACEVLEALKKEERTNSAMHAFALCMKAHFMYEAGIEGSNVIAKQAVVQLDEMIEQVAENSEYTVEEVLDNVDAITVVWVMIVSLLEKTLSDEEWEKVYGGKTRKEVLTLAKERGFRLSRIPSNLRDGLPGDWERVLGFSYFGPLSVLSSRLDSVQEEVAMLETAVEVQLVQGTLRVPEFLRLPNHLPEELSYSAFIKLFNWDKFTYPNASQLVVSLPKLGIARLQLLKQLETESNTDAYDICMTAMAQEIDYGLKAANKYSNSPPTEGARKAMKVAKGEFLILKGRMIARQKNRGEAEQQWEEARNALIGIEEVQANGLDMIEKKRLDSLKLIEDLLSRVIEP